MLNSNYDENPQKSLSDLKSEAVYSWPNQIQQGDQDLFHFPGFQDSSESREMNNVDIGEYFFTAGLDVRFFQGLQIYCSLARSQSTPVAQVGKNFNNLNTPTTVSHVPYTLANLSHANIYTMADANTLPYVGINTPAEANTLSHANINTPADANTLSHANFNTLADANTLSHANINTPADATLSLNQKETTVKKTKKHKLDNADLILPDGSCRDRKKKGSPDENLPASTKRGKKKESGRKQGNLQVFTILMVYFFVRLWTLSVFDQWFVTKKSDIIKECTKKSYN